MIHLTEWGVVGVIVVLVSLIGVFVKLTYSLSSILQKLSSAVESLQLTINDFKASNAKTHERIFTQLAELEKRLNETATKVEILSQKVNS